MFKQLALFMSVLCVIPYAGITQSTYFNIHEEYAFQPPDGGGGAGIIVETDTEFVLIGEVYEYLFNWERFIRVLFVDKEGGFQSEKIYAQEFKQKGMSSRGFSSYGDNYYLCGTIRDTSGTVVAALYNFDENFDTLAVWTYGDSGDFNSAIRVLPQEDGTFYLMGSTSRFGSNDMTLRKLDEEGNMLWENFWGGNGNESVRGFVPSAEAGKFIISGATTSYGNPRKGFVAKIDTLGNQDWITFLGNPLYNEFMLQTLRLSDDNYLVYGSYIEFINGAGNAETRSVAYKVDEEGNVLWERKLGDTNTNTQFVSAHQLPNGNIVLAGNTFNIWGTLTQITLDGDSLWMRKFSHYPNNSLPPVAQLTRDMIPTQDGGFITTGWVDAQSIGGTQDMWAVKFNCLGYDSMPEPQFSYTIAPDFEVLFTNESQRATTYLWDFEDGFLSNLEHPAYTFPDTGYYPVTLYAIACGDTVAFQDTVYISSATSVQEVQKNQLKLYPNPAQNEFFVEFTDQMASEITVAIYNIMGQEVNSYSLPENNRLRIGTENWRNGLYLITFKDKHGMEIDKKKVVIRK